MNSPTNFLKGPPDVCFSDSFLFLLEFSQCVHDTYRPRAPLAKGFGNSRWKGKQTDSQQDVRNHSRRFLPT